MNNELKHYGVIGQKWGVRRYQNADGSLTALGKQRYYTDEDSQKGYEQAKTQLKNVSTSPYSVYRDGGYTIDNDDIKEAGEFLKGQNSAITSEFNNICTKTAKHYNDLNYNSKFKNEVMKRLKEELSAGDQVDDEDLLALCVEEAVHEIESKYRSEDLQKSYANFENGVRTYYENVKSITDDIVGKCGDMTVAESVKYTQTKTKGLFAKTNMVPTKTQYKYKDVVEGTLHELGQSRWVRYLYNHSEMAYLENPGYDARENLHNNIAKEFMKTKSK